MNETRIWLGVLVYIGIGLLLAVVALGYLFPAIRLSHRWTAVMALFGAWGALTHAYRLGDA
jgi:hypothetical protein